MYRTLITFPKKVMFLEKMRMDFYKRDAYNTCKLSMKMDIKGAFRSILYNNKKLVIYVLQKPEYVSETNANFREERQYEIRLF